jgi:hypothetical protein
VAHRASREAFLVIVAAIIIADDTGFAQRQAFYDALKAGDDKKAIEIGKAYLVAHPSADAFALDVAYAELRAGDRDDALALFRRLAESSNAQVRSGARQQLAVMSGGGASRGYAYNAVLYESRFNDFILDGFDYYDLGKPSALTPYVALHYTYDTASAIGLGQIYYQHYVSADLGLRHRFNPYVYAYAEAGYSAGLSGEASFFESRYGLAGSRDFGVLNSDKPHALVDGSLAVYSRFQGNTIGYVQMHYDAKLWGHLRPSVGWRAYADSQRLTYNNFLEVHEGAIYWFTPGLYLEGYGVQGTYDGRGTPRAVSPGYTTWRVLLVSGLGIK